MNHLNELHITCQFKDLREIESDIESNWHIYNQQLLKTIPNEVERTNDVMRYISVAASLVVLNDSTVNKYFDVKEIDDVKTTLTTEANALRELLNLAYSNNDGKKGETGTPERSSSANYFTKFDRLYNILMSE